MVLSKETSVEYLRVSGVKVAMGGEVPLNTLAGTVDNAIIFPMLVVASVVTLIDDELGPIRLGNDVLAAKLDSGFATPVDADGLPFGALEAAIVGTETREEVVPALLITNTWVSDAVKENTEAGDDNFVSLGARVKLLGGALLLKNLTLVLVVGLVTLASRENELLSIDGPLLKIAE